MDPITTGALITGGSLLAGQLLRSSERPYGHADAQAHSDAYQREYAQNAIQWRVADAKKAGLHPLAALGAAGASYTPTSLSGGSDSGWGDTYSAMGQDIGRAIASKQTDTERRLSALQLMSLEKDIQGKELDNQMRASQLAKMTSPSVPPPAPGPKYSIPGQSSSDLVLEKPAERTRNAPGNRSQEAGSVTSYGFADTPNGGLQIVPSKDMKERIEDQLIQELGWSIKNQFVPMVNGPPPPDPKQYPLPKGMRWQWDPWEQEFQPTSKPAPKSILQEHGSLFTVPFKRYGEWFKAKFNGRR